MTFQSLGLVAPILKALEIKGYTHPTPIQEQAIPLLIEGHDLLGCAQTGTGKTAAFSIPMLQVLVENGVPKGRGYRPVQALIVSPTRELAIQIGDSIRDYGKFTGLRHTVIFGGVKPALQLRELKRGVDILVATPGRLLDLMGQGFIQLDEVEYFVLDEADQMLDMGFIHDIRRIIKELPENRQSLFFSATMPPDIVKLSEQILFEPKSITIAPDKPTADRVDQAVYFVSKRDKRKLLLEVLREGHGDSALVFSRTKYGADKIARMLWNEGIRAEAIHGNKTQQARQKTLKNFRAGKTPVLVATDIAARGIDVASLELVINYDLPNMAETYVHRIGRTGRAGNEGQAVSLVCVDEKYLLRGIERLLKRDIPKEVIPGYEPDPSIPPEPIPNGRNNQRGRGRRGGGGHHGRPDGRSRGSRPNVAKGATPKSTKSKPILKSRRT